MIWRFLGATFELWEIPTIFGVLNNIWLAHFCWVLLARNHLFSSRVRNFIFCFEIFLCPRCVLVCEIFRIVFVLFVLSFDFWWTSVELWSIWKFCRLHLGHLCSFVGHLWISVGHLWTSLSHLWILVGNLWTSVSHLWTLVGHLWTEWAICGFQWAICGILLLDFCGSTYELFRPFVDFYVPTMNFYGLFVPSLNSLWYPGSSWCHLRYTELSV